MLAGCPRKFTNGEGMKCGLHQSRNLCELNILLIRSVSFVWIGLFGLLSALNIGWPMCRCRVYRTRGTTPRATSIQILFAPQIALPGIASSVLFATKH